MGNTMEYIDIKSLQAGDHTEYSMPDHPYKPYHQAHRSPEDPKKAAKTINDFYANKDQYLAFEALVGKEQAMLWMATLLERTNDISR